MTATSKHFSALHGMLMWHLLENCVSVTTVTLVLSLVILTLSPRMPAKQHSIHCVMCTHTQYTQVPRLDMCSQSGQPAFCSSWLLTVVQ